MGDHECKSPTITEHDQSGKRNWVTGNMGYQCCSLDVSDDANRHGCTRGEAYTLNKLFQTAQQTISVCVQWKKWNSEKEQQLVVILTQRWFGHRVVACNQWILMRIILEMVYFSNQNHLNCSIIQGEECWNLREMRKALSQLVL